MYVKGVGPARAAMLEAKGLSTIEDLLTYAPFRYEDRSNVKTIAQLAPGEMATVLTEVRSANSAVSSDGILGCFKPHSPTRRAPCCEPNGFTAGTLPTSSFLNSGSHCSAKWNSTATRAS